MEEAWLGGNMQRWFVDGIWGMWGLWSLAVVALCGWMCRWVDVLAG